ncbi:MAG: formate dehydrogenase accessory sulfurtransferase FdhD [Deltaproteobacteria bacterium]|nr:formate dehydrogenase accessory sulfurtransferase FdhD [Deltaproteobacteria bacterium]
MNSPAPDVEPVLQSIEIAAIKYNGVSSESTNLSLITEEPLSIRVEGEPYAVVMRTPGDEIYHVAGFCLSEGIVDVPGDFGTIGFCEEVNSNVTTVTLTAKRRQSVAHILNRKGFVSQTSCGICGKSVIDDISQAVDRIDATITININQIFYAAGKLIQYQPIYKNTHSAHGAVIFDANLDALAWAEDVGRHNALDKAIGKVFMSELIDKAAIGVMSSRLSYELVQKAARAGIEVLIGVSRPTALAVTLARAVGMTLVCARDANVFVFCGEERMAS